jgi:hypothetical protein
LSSLGKLGAATFLIAVAAFAVEHRGDSASADTGAGPDATTSGANHGGGGAPGPSAVADIPAAYLAHYKAAGTTCPNLDWALLAGIGKVETNHGRLKAPGVTSGANFAGAAGPMQFLPSTFRGVRKRHPELGTNLYDPAVAIPAAAHLLCDNGVRRGNAYAAIFSYNHADWYVTKVQNKAADYRRAA